MANTTVRISEIEPESANALGREIETRLLQTLRKTQPQAHNASLVLAAHDDEQRLVGGLTANCSYGWLLVKTLWVDDAHQRCGIGSKLMNEAERFAQTANCHGIWLDTSSAKARRFYLSSGYEEFGRLDNLPGQLPEDHHRWFLRKCCAIADNAG